MRAPAEYTPRVLRRSEVALLVAMYWPWDEQDNALAVAVLESGLDTGAWNVSGEDSRGLWQVNVAPGAHPDLATSNLWDPMVNAFWAYNIWKESGWRAWYNSALRLGLL